MLLRLQRACYAITWFAAILHQQELLLCLHVIDEAVLRPLDHDHNPMVQSDSHQSEWRQKRQGAIKAD